MGNGHVFIPKNKLTAAVSEMLSVDGNIVLEALDALCEYGDIRISQIAGVEGCYLKHMFEAECYVAERLLQMANHAPFRGRGWRETPGVVGANDKG